MDRVELSKQRILEYISLWSALNKTKREVTDLIEEEQEAYQIGKDEYYLWNEAVKLGFKSISKSYLGFKLPMSRAKFTPYRSEHLEANKPYAKAGGVESMLEAYDFGISIEDIIA